MFWVSDEMPYHKIDIDCFLWNSGQWHESHDEPEGNRLLTVYTDTLAKFVEVPKMM